MSIVALALVWLVGVAILVLVRWGVDRHRVTSTRWVKGGPIKECSHWPRDVVQLADGTTVAYICRRCDHDWADENYINA